MSNLLQALYQRINGTIKKNISFTQNIALLFLSYFLIINLLSCAHFGATKPNEPFEGNFYPIELEFFVTDNQILANEIGKLPEFQDGISDYEITALKNFCNLYKAYPQQFNDVFNEMLKVGKPEYRKYCSPLQALYWLIEDGRINEAKSVLQNYKLSTLLNYAWSIKVKEVEKFKLTEKQIIS